ncbi:MAG TPA: ABC transporter ATP-binding protein [Clostridia bacterium]|nr:ABC transporter ATP-binding protein [Clostridia bacterium]
MVHISNVSKSYAGKKAVDNISFDVDCGEIFGFLGPNGAGKTTTIKMIVGLLAQDSGTIKIQGIDVEKNSLESKKLLSYVPDNPELYANLTGRAYLNFLADVYGVSEEDRQRRIEKYGQLFEMQDSVDQFISSYSHGMKQKMAVMGALIHDPDLLIMDEPMVGLDPKSAFRLKELMRERCDKKKSVFFSTHVMEVAEKICDRIAIISKGEIIAVGSMEEIRKQARDKGSLEKIFLELTE